MLLGDWRRRDVFVQVEVYPSVGSSSLIVYFQKMLESPDMWCALSLSATKTTDGWLKTLVRLMVKYNCFEVSGCCSSTPSYEFCDPLGYCCPSGIIWLC